MPWKECSKVDERGEFVRLAKVEGANVRGLCERFGISRKTGHKWLRRFGSKESLVDRSRRPQHSPRRTARKMEQAVLGVRDRHPVWGGRKIAARLQDMGHQGVPAPSTITEILRRHERLDEAEAIKHRPYQRFERARPNELWQMDFKGHFGLRDGTRCHALTVLDDHSRYALGVRACDNERRETVQTELIELFRRYGLPLTMLMDNGAPWGTGDWHNRYTSLVVWLLRLGVEVMHGRPYHPQTQGKDERFHRTLSEELLSRAEFENLLMMQLGFDRFRFTYNHERPHEALGLTVPAKRYLVSERIYPERLPPIEYPSSMTVRCVSEGWLSYKGRAYRVNKAFSGYRVGLSPSDQDGLLHVFFCRHRIGQITVPIDN
jgi:transposase InsO family protein